jgi:hypothetical protein
VTAADQRALDALEELHDLRRDALLRQRRVRPQLHQLPEVVRGLLREPDPEVGAAAVLVGLRQDVLAARRQRARAERLEARDQLVEDDDRAALLRPVELGHRPRERVLRGLHLGLQGGGGLRRRGLLCPRGERRGEQQRERGERARSGSDRGRL